MSIEKRLRYLERAWRERAAREGAALDGAALDGAAPDSDWREAPAGASPQEGPALAGQGQPPLGERADHPLAPERGWEQVGRFTLRRRLDLPVRPFRSGISELLLPRGYAPSDVLLFDTETTGLSGGAGNSVFLIGMGWIEGGGLAVEQLFLKDFPGEAEFLEVLQRRLSRHRVFVSYNGRAYDAHVLRTRFLLNRMAIALDEQTDLLYWSRRLWRRTLRDCSLGNIEREILGIRRRIDVPGFEVPGIYLQYLRSGLPGRLEAVLEHNLQDVRSLAELLATVNSVLLSRGGAEEEASVVEAAARRADRASLGSYLLGKDERWAVELLSASFAAGDDGAGRALSLHYKRSGQWKEALRVWEQMAGRRKSLFACIELAKYFEHRERDAGRALDWVQRILSWGLPLDPISRAEINHRRRRLLKKLGD